jgi:UDP-glucose 4-epimerase
MKIIVTGALGHIGSSLIRYLPKTFPDTRIVLIDSLITQRFSSLFNLPSNGKFSFYNEDVREFDFSKVVSDGDVIINLSAITDAAGSFKNPELLEKNNYNCTEKIAYACIKSNARLITISSTSVYGSTKNIVDESSIGDDLNPQSPYAMTKLMEEDLVRKLYDENGLQAVILRFGTIFGYSPGMRFHTAVNKFCWQSVLNEPLTIWETAYEQKRPYLDLNDAVKALCFFIKEGIFDGEIYNVLTGNHSVKDVVDHIKLNIPSVSIDFVKNEIMNQLSYEVSVDKLKSKGFTFNGSLEKGIEETISVLRSSNN